MMRDIREVGFLIAVPAAVTILGVLWFLRKKTNGGGPKNSAKKKKEDSDFDNKNLNNGQEDIPFHQNRVEKEGITLTQRKIPEQVSHKSNNSLPDCEAGSSKNDNDQSGNVDTHALTEAEMEKAKEIVDAAIEAGVLKVAEEYLELGKGNKSTCENNTAVEPTDLNESSITKSHADMLKEENDSTHNKTGGFDESGSSSVGENNNSSCKNIVENHITLTNSNHSLESDNQDVLASVEEHFSSSKSPVKSAQPSTNLNASANANIVHPSPSNSQGEEIASSHNNQSDILSSLDHISPAMQPCEEAVISCTYSANLSSSVLPSNISTDSGVCESTSVPEIKSDRLDNNTAPQPEAVAQKEIDGGEASQSGQKCVESSTVPTEDIMKVDLSTEQQGKKQEDSFVISNSSYCDNNSVDSCDSGRGGSEQDSLCHNTSNDTTVVQYDFNMPSELCGRLIGRLGKNISFIKNRSGANVSLSHHPVSGQFQICHVRGTQTEVDKALALIRKRFPEEDYPHLNMAPITMIPNQPEPAPAVLVPDNMQLSLPDGASVEVYVSTIVDAGHIFVQQPTHRSFMSLEKLNFFLQSVYSQDESIPCIPTPVECGVICVCENEGSWYRAMIMSPEDEYGECQVKFVDYGGYSQLPIKRLKQIRADFMNLPFQAVECFMANVAPLQGEEYFSPASTMALSEMSQMKLLQCQVVARNEIGTPYIHLYLINPDTNTATLVNRALVNEGMVRWVEIL